MLLAPLYVLQWQVEAEPPFEIINISATTDRDIYNRTDLIKINYSLFCKGNNANNRNMHLKLNNSFDFSRPLETFVQLPQGSGNIKNKYKFIDQDKTLAVELYDDNNDWAKAKLTTILCNITSNVSCPIGIYDLTDKAFTKLNCSDSNACERIPKVITIKDNPPIVSNFTGNTHIAKQGDALEFDFLLGDKDSENISWTLSINNSTIDVTNNTTNVQFNRLEQMKVNYSSSSMLPGFYIFQVYAQSNKGGYARSSSWDIEIISQSTNQYVYIFLFALLIISLVFYFFTPNSSIVISFIISIFLLVIQYMLFETRFLLVSFVTLLTIVCMSFLISLYLIENGQESALKAIKMSLSEKSISKMLSNSQKFKTMKIASLMISYLWMSIVMMILILFSSEIYGQNKIILSSYLGVLLFSFVPEFLFRFTKCKHLYVSFLFILCAAFIGLLVESLEFLYIPDFTNAHHALNIALTVFFSLIFLPIHVYIYLIYVERVKQPENH